MKKEPAAAGSLRSRQLLLYRLIQLIQKIWPISPLNNESVMMMAMMVTECTYFKIELEIEHHLLKERILIWNRLPGSR